MESDRSITWQEIEHELLEAVQAADAGDETALAILPEYLQASREKRDRVAYVYRRFDSDIEYIDREIERLNARKQQVQSQKARLGHRVLSIMQALGQTKLEGITSTFAVRQNPSSVQITNEADVPGEYKTVKQEVVISKKEIATALKQGKEVSGVSLVPGAVRLEVR